MRRVYPFWETHTLPLLISWCAEGLRKAHSGEVPFCRDGCYFLHKECRYDPDGPTPLALFWKDPACSQFFMDTDMKGNISQYQHVVLKVSDDGCVVTGDDPPLILGQAPHSDGCSHRYLLLKHFAPALCILCSVLGLGFFGLCCKKSDQRAKNFWCAHTLVAMQEHALQKQLNDHTCSWPRQPWLILHLLQRWRISLIDKGNAGQASFWDSAYKSRAFSCKTVHRNM